MVKNIKKIFSLVLISTFCFAGCTNSSDYYVQGLINISQNENEKAIKHFEKSVKKGSDVEVLLSLRELEKLNVNSSKMLNLTKLSFSKLNKYAEICSGSRAKTKSTVFLRLSLVCPGIPSIISREILFIPADLASSTQVITSLAVCLRERFFSSLSLAD